MPYILVLVLVLLAQTKLFSALQTPVALYLFLKVLLVYRKLDMTLEMQVMLFQEGC